MLSDNTLKDVTMTSKRNAKLNTASAFAFTFFPACNYFAGFYWRWYFKNISVSMG